MNIVFFSGRIIYGGGEKVRNWLAGRLIDAGHTVYYASPRLNDEFLSQLNKVGLYGRVVVKEYPYHLKKIKPVKYWSAIKRLFHECNADLYVIFGGSLVEQVIARRNGVKVVLSERCEPGSRSIPSQILKQIQYRIADGYVFQTPEASMCYGKQANRLSIVIPNPIIDELPDPKFDNLRKEIVSVGRLSGEKNQIMLLDAFNKFHKVHPEYRLKIYGSGPLEGLLLDTISKYNLNNCAEIIKGKRNISELINGSELFVLPSNTEGMPNALIEAMSVGIQSISTNCPIYGPKMLVEHGVNGYLTPIKDTEALYKQMCYAVEHPTQADQIRHNAIKIRERLQADVIFDKWLSYFQTIV